MINDECVSSLSYLRELRVQKPQRGKILVNQLNPSVFLAPAGRNIGSKSIK
jgi:hypothetical protein